MRRHAAAGAALWSTSILLSGLGIAYLWISRSVSTPASWGFRGFPIPLAITFASVGFYLVLRQPRNRVAWLTCTLGLVISLIFATQEYATFAAIANGDRGWLPMTAAWLQSWIWIWMVALICYLFLLFPDGALPSPRWRFFPWALGIVCVAFTLEIAFAYEKLDNFEALDNAYNVGALEPLTALEIPILLAFAACPLGAAASLVGRALRGTYQERQQVKWLSLTGILMGLGLLLHAFPPILDVAEVLVIGAMLSIPISISIALLRYRLYDVDVVINRTLVYVVLSAFLALSYLVLVVALQEVLGTFDSGNNLAVAASTLAVAALFTPARRAIQGFIDRRFYRNKYDAEKTLSDFSDHLRDEVDLTELMRRLETVVQETMQPKHSSVWVRPRSTGST